MRFKHAAAVAAIIGSVGLAFACAPDYPVNAAEVAAPYCQYDAHGRTIDVGLVGHPGRLFHQQAVVVTSRTPALVQEAQGRPGTAYIEFTWPSKPSGLRVTVTSIYGTYTCEPT